MDEAQLLYPQLGLLANLGLVGSGRFIKAVHGAVGPAGGMGAVLQVKRIADAHIAKSRCRWGGAMRGGVECSVAVGEGGIVLACLLLLCIAAAEVRGVPHRARHCACSPLRFVTHRLVM
jgi:hypothetical protein